MVKCIALVLRSKWTKSGDNRRLYATKHKKPPLSQPKAHALLYITCNKKILRDYEHPEFWCTSYMTLCSFTNHTIALAQNLLQHLTMSSSLRLKHSGKNRCLQVCKYLLLYLLNPRHECVLV